MGRPLPQLLIFFAVGMVLITLAPDTDQSLPDEELGNVTISAQQNTYEADPDEDSSNIFVDLASCVNTLIGVLSGNGFVCDPIQDLWSNTIGQTAIGKAITTVTEGLGDFVRLMTQVLTFNVPGAPLEVRWAFSIVLTGITGYIVVSLVRGAG